MTYFLYICLDLYLFWIILVAVASTRKLRVFLSGESSCVPSLTQIGNYWAMKEKNLNELRVGSFGIGYESFKMVNKYS